ncbi:MAG TPA: iron ABC transporter permease [Candidatus Omnitrophota bacterium]|nr:iron ABC transporter permease [Candidatus Omnitrophota bacterium]HQO38687.1 iron ABC transporter permease [Candidatus Omnitrophota bacterium]HQQ06403.1 iron ABC transporter permease [Candidatus Omnitrophota bacterium]
MNKRKARHIAVLICILGVVLAAGLMTGAVHIPFREILSADNRIILNMRLMRMITAMLAGCGLAVSGIALQAILRNPLAEPYLLGTSSGAALAAVIAVVLGVSRVYMPLAAFCGAVISIILVYSIAQEGKRISDRSLILAGVVVSVALSALIVFLVSIFGNRALHEMAWWLWGSLQVYDNRLIGIVALPVVAGIIAIAFFSQDLNAISIGEEEAGHLGIDTEKVKKILLLITALVTASLICICGIIGFVGLIVPHMMRLIVGPDHKILIPATCLCAAVFMVACDILSRTLFAPVEIPIGVITAVIGAPVFIVLLKKGRRI